MPAILIDGAFVCVAGVAREGGVLVEGGRIAAVAWADEDRRALRLRAGEVVDGAGCWLLPGLIDAHAHAYGTLLRGTQNSLPLELWALFTTAYGRVLDAEGIRLAILLGAAERLRGGVTGTVDHAPAMHLAEVALAAHEASGLRVAYAPFLQDISDYDLLGIALPEGLAGGPPPLDADAYSGRFAELVQAVGSGRVRVQLGPNAPQRCSEAAWALWRTLRDRHGVAVHTHLLETRAQQSLNARWPGGLVAAMGRAGLLERGLTCAHGVWLSDAERETLARHDVTLSHNPASNLMLGSGAMNLRGCVACGLRVALGTDSANTGGRHDLFSVMRLGLMLPRLTEDFSAWPEAALLFAAATEGGAAALGWGGEVGRIEAGQLADLVLLRADAAGTLAGTPSVAALVQHGGPEYVTAVMVGGRWALRGGRVLAFDEGSVIAEAADYLRQFEARAAGQVAAVRAALPGLTTRFRGVCG
jgi:5-methylthioadenosine/S-adenosylhomocysteine deaminase